MDAKADVSERSPLPVVQGWMNVMSEVSERPLTPPRRTGMDGSIPYIQRVV